jgi:phosphoribosylaminoimidazole-succinocarboxamide synthase
VLPQGVPDKGRVLTEVSAFWFRKLADICPHHMISVDVDDMPAVVREHAEVLRGRAMLVRRCKPFPVECVARGYLAGSGLKDYRETGAVCGNVLPPGLENSSRLPDTLFTPATKAAEGHDENIDFARMASILGEDTATELRRLTLELYESGAAYAAERGVILADTKFEFGLHAGAITLIDEALTPDSSRYWDASIYRPGSSQPSFDKQPVRDWLEASGWDKQPPPPDLPDTVVAATSARYRGIYARLTGTELA